MALSAPKNGRMPEISEEAPLFKKKLSNLVMISPLPFKANRSLSLF
jgi:hypothetical protein